MAVPNTFSAGTLIESAKVNANFAYVGVVPIGTVLPWLKTFASADSGTTNSTTANKLVQSGQNFETTIEVGYCVYNSTDATFAYITAVDSDTTLSLDADIMVSGEAYTIYKTPELDNHFVECNGQTLSDADSVFNGVTLPNLNGNLNVLYGNSTSGSIRTEDFLPIHSHTIPFANSYGGSGNIASTTNAVNDSRASNSSSAAGTAWRGYSVVFIMRVK